MGTTSDILTAAKALTVTVLGAEYKELPFSFDIAKNKFAGGSKGYAVLPGQIDQAEGVTRYLTADQDFEVTLTETFASSQVGDSSQRDTAATLFTRMEGLYTRMVSDKAGLPATVLLVSRLRVLAPQFLDSNVAVLRATFSIKYRTAL